MKKLAKFCVICIFSFFSCSDDVVLITVASKRACYCDFTGWVRPTFMYRERNNDTWETVSEIKDFVYEPGYEYILEVTWHEKNPRPQDSSSSYMQLERIVSKTQKETNFPPTLQWKIYDESWSLQKPCEEVFGSD